MIANLSDALVVVDEQADRIAALEAEVESLRIGLGEEAAIIEELITENQQLARECDEMRQAFAPWREMGPAFAEAVQQIRDERDKQNQKWGEQNHDGGLWLKILMEEVGELSQAMLHDEFGGRAAGTVDAELVQVAAVAVQWMECRRRKVSGKVVRDE